MYLKDFMPPNVDAALRARAEQAASELAENALAGIIAHYQVTPANPPDSHPYGPVCKTLFGLLVAEANLIQGLPQELAGEDSGMVMESRLRARGPARERGKSPSRIIAGHIIPARAYLTEKALEDPTTALLFLVPYLEAMARRRSDLASCYIEMLNGHINVESDGQARGQINLLLLFFAKIAPSLPASITIYANAALAQTVAIYSAITNDLMHSHLQAKPVRSGRHKRLTKSKNTARKIKKAYSQLTAQQKLLSEDSIARAIQDALTERRGLTTIKKHLKLLYANRPNQS